MIDWTCPYCGYRNTTHDNVRVKKSKCYNCKKDVLGKEMINMEYWHL
ncbi:MAG: hypothetical protein ACFFAO_06565 [Candidatus Hermodarchaeota archaeon]